MLIKADKKKYKLYFYTKDNYQIKLFLKFDKVFSNLF